MNTQLTGFLAMTATAIGAAALFWLLREHWRHVLPFLGYLPYLLFLACPLMHVFMHHGRKHGHPPEKSAQAGKVPLAGAM